jgi:hypothetical protein
MAKTLLEKIEGLIGTVVAFDGRYCLWTATGPHDVRDVATRLKTNKDDIADALPDFAPKKRGRAVLTEDTPEE